VASLSQGRTAAAQCGLFTYKSVPVIFEPPCIIEKGVQFSLSSKFYSVVAAIHKMVQIKFLCEEPCFIYQYLLKLTLCILYNGPKVS